MRTIPALKGGVLKNAVRFWYHSLAFTFAFLVLQSRSEERGFRPNDFEVNRKGLEFRWAISRAEKRKADGWKQRYWNMNYNNNKCGRIVYFNGSFVPEDQAKLSIYDSAIATGEKVVEVSRTFAHKLYGLETHLERLFSNLQLLRINPGLSKREMEGATYETLQRNLATQAKSVDWQILHYISRGPAAHFGIVPDDELYPTVVIQCIPLVNRLGKMAKRYTEGADLVVVDQRLIPSDVIPAQLKSNGRMDHIIGRVHANDIFIV